MTSTFPNPPTIAKCGSTTPPNLPQSFHAIALLTPFNNSQLVVADIYYDWSLKAMRITTYGLEHGYADFLYIQNEYFILDSENGGPPKNFFGPIATTEQVPPPNWLVNFKASCNGIGDVLNQKTSWWCSLTKNTNGTAPVPPTPCPNIDSANWFWLRADNQMPWRMMLINTTNEFNLPFIGWFAFAHFPTFESMPKNSLSDLVNTCRSRSKPIDMENAAPLRINSYEDVYNMVRAKPLVSGAFSQTNILDSIQDLIPGLFPPGNNSLPTWPNQLFMTALTTPTFEPHPFPNQPYPTQVYYDWSNQRQLTRFYLPDQSLEDAILTSSKSYLINRFSNGTHKCLGTVPVGLPYPNWTERDGGVCKGVIKNNPQLSPNKTTQIFTLNSMPPRVFWIWYTTTNQAIMFAEVPQACNVELILTDYFDYNPAPPPFDPSLFVIPADCLSSGKKSASGKGIKKSATVKLAAKATMRKPVKKSIARSARIAGKKPSGNQKDQRKKTSKPVKKAAAGKSAKKIKKAVVREPIKRTMTKADHKSTSIKKK